GHDRVQILDGGFRAWQAAGKPVEQGLGTPPERRQFEAHPRSDDTVTAEDVQRGGLHLLDARAPERWRGDVEPLDPKPGRIPGSINAPATENLRELRFRSPDELRAYYESLGILDGRPIAASCGSGVSACVDLVGLELAGIGGAKLYPGSYSEWLAKGLPVDQG
ncbi:MAG TPA: rhodanese-like domain-containing protein, partial [Chloroflexota bacterium]|nr:rhodanese-like domain-containing protein [Chloroflexota bacterium]